MSQAATKQSSATKLEPPRFEDGKPLLIAGLRQTYTPAAMRSLPAQWQAFAPHIGKIPGQIGRTAYGICWQAPGSSNIEYLTGVEVSTFAGMPDNFTVVSLPAAKYAVFPHRDHVSKLYETCDAISGGCRNPAISPPPQATLKHRRSSNVIVKNSIRRGGWAAWKFGLPSNRKRNGKRVPQCSCN